jgi:hypothetical protein
MSCHVIMLPYYLRYVLSIHVVLYGVLIGVSTSNWNGLTWLILLCACLSLLPLILLPLIGRPHLIALAAANASHSAAIDVAQQFNDHNNDIHHHHRHQPHHDKYDYGSNSNSNSNLNNSTGYHQVTSQ